MLKIVTKKCRKSQKYAQLPGSRKTVEKFILSTFSQEIPLGKWQAKWLMTVDIRYKLRKIRGENCHRTANENDCVFLYSDALNLWHFHAWLISIWKLFMRYVTNQSQIFYRQPGFSLAKLKNKFGIFVDARSNYAKMPKSQKKNILQCYTKKAATKKKRKNEGKPEQFSQATHKNVTLVSSPGKKNQKKSTRSI